MSEDGDGPRNSAGNTPRGRPFQPGNPGKPRGVRNRASVMAQRLIDGQGEQVVQAVVRAAIEGDMIACRLVLERLLPPRRTRSVELPDLPAVEGANDVQAAMAAVLQATASGELTPDEGRALADIVEGSRKAIETTEILVRLEKLEELAAKSGHGR